MTLIKSISGIRGTIGGNVGDNLTPLDVVKFTAAFITFIKKDISYKKPSLALGRDARISGPMFSQIIIATANAMGVDVIDLGLSTTPTVEIAVPLLKADGGIIITASHNPAEWNALKLLNSKGEFLSAIDGDEILKIADQEDFTFNGVHDLGTLTIDNSFFDKHIQMIMDLPLIDQHIIEEAKLKIAIDCVNSTGGLVLPELLKRLGVDEVIEIYCEPNGQFPHNPEPLAENLSDISKLVVERKCDLGFVVDPDVDRLAIINEDVSMFGEEFTLVAVADYVLQNKSGNTVSNLSSTISLKEITEKHKGNYAASAVGEVNVVELMKQTNAIIGGEGNGGVIYPALHYGRDALVGIALFLMHLAKSKLKCSALRATYSNHHISKNKIELPADTNMDLIFNSIQRKYQHQPTSRIDGLRIEFENAWVHLRKSNTEPIIRIYAESTNKEKAEALASTIIKSIKESLL